MDKRTLTVINKIDGILFFIVYISVLLSCKLPNQDKRIFDPTSTAFKTGFNPQPGSNYHYDITNTTETNIELENKEVHSITTTTTGMSYGINNDSTGNYIVKMLYDKVHLYTKNNDLETHADAENAEFSLYPADKMLGALKNANLTVSVSPSGDVKMLSGYKELSQQLMASLDPNDINARAVAQQHLDKLIGEQLIQKNLDQFFKMFPDSAIRIGDKWKMDSKRNGDFVLNIKTFYKLEDIDKGLAYVTSESKIESDNSPIAVMGYSVVPNLKGTQKGKYEVEAQTGMLLNGTITSEINGNMQAAGKEVPIKIKMKVNIVGKRVQ